MFARKLNGSDGAKLTKENRPRPGFTFRNCSFKYLTRFCSCLSTPHLLWQKLYIFHHPEAVAALRLQSSVATKQLQQKVRGQPPTRGSFIVLNISPD